LTYLCNCGYISDGAEGLQPLKKCSEKTEGIQEMKRRILVFTGSSAGDDASYVRAAHDTGQVVAERGDILVYGGGSPGGMGALAWERSQRGA